MYLEDGRNLAYTHTHAHTHTCTGGADTLRCRAPLCALPLRRKAGLGFQRRRAGDAGQSRAQRMLQGGQRQEGRAGRAEPDAAGRGRGGLVVVGTYRKAWHAQRQRFLGDAVSLIEPCVCARECMHACVRACSTGRARRTPRCLPVLSSGFFIFKKTKVVRNLLHTTTLATTTRKLNPVVPAIPPKSRCHCAPASPLFSVTRTAGCAASPAHAPLASSPLTRVASHLLLWGERDGPLALFLIVRANLTPF